MDIFDPENGVTFKGIEGAQDGLINDAEVHSPRGEVLLTESGADLRGRVLDPTFVAYSETSYRGQIPSLEGHACALYKTNSFLYTTFGNLCGF